ncbi:hypothetical protein GC207_05570 [bacterium]|nr:hypothetical protein [bacterium]
MNVFRCDRCQSLVYFESVRCVQCGSVLGYLPDVGDVSAIEAKSDDAWRALSPAADNAEYRRCGNSKQHEVCNWLVPADDPAALCKSCCLNDTIPDLRVTGNLERWRKLETAKRRVIYTLLKLGLPLNGGPTDDSPPLRFRFLGKPDFGPTPVTGHAHGVITVNIAEADDDERERIRVQMRESYRTLLGHFRHEVAHYFWDQLIAGTDRLIQFRELFGDETLSYGDALQHFYQYGPSANWSECHITAYASAHPWEDWAETWAHYLHIVDTLDTATSFGISFLPPTADDKKAATVSTGDVAKHPSVQTLLTQWLPLTTALNSINRSMGLHDLYPFILSQPVIAKLEFVAEIVSDGGPGKRQSQET